MSSTTVRYRRHCEEIHAGRYVSRALAAFWTVLALVGGGFGLGAAAAVAVTLVGGVVADRVGNAYRIAEN